MNLKILLLSIFGLICIALAFFLSWWFMAGAVIVMIINQRELMNNPSKCSKKK